MQFYHRKYRPELTWRKAVVSSWPFARLLSFCVPRQITAKQILPYPE
jgi:hypothetical protein